MKKRLLAVLVVSVLALVMLSGCGGINVGGVKVSDNADGSSKVSIGGTSVETGASWPSSWPSDIPKLNGTVKSSVSTDVHSSAGLSVFLSVANIDVVKAYANDLMSKGYTAGTTLDEGGDYAVSLKGSAYNVSVTYSHDTNDASVTVTAVQ